MDLWLRARAILKASWELAALIEDQLPLTFQESLILFSICLEKIGFRGSEPERALPVLNLVFSSIISLIPVGTILKVRMAKGSV